MQTFETSGTVCPTCGSRNDANTAVSGERGPAEGDFCVCFGCGEICRYTVELKLRKCETPELQQLPSRERRMLRTLAAKLRFRRN